MMNRTGIGGFFELELPISGGTNLLQHWQQGLSPHWYGFRNGRSALHYLLSRLESDVVWLPSYLCSAVLEGVPHGLSVQFYRHDDRLLPMVEELAEKLQYGDAVVAIDYFGRPPSDAFLELVKNRRDVFWIEDRAYSLADGSCAWGDAVLYSPRKLLGVPDGGLLMFSEHKFNNRVFEAPTFSPSADVAFMLPSLMRAEDREGRFNRQWYDMYQGVEAEMSVSRQPLSALSEQVLVLTSVETLRSSRRRNYDLLYRQLAEFAFMGEAAGFIPSAFVLRHPAASRLSPKLHSQKIFAQRHWLNMPSPANIYATEHALCQQLLTLPCDHRYGEEEMSAMCAALKPYL